MPTVHCRIQFEHCISWDRIITELASQSMQIYIDIKFISVIAEWIYLQDAWRIGSIRMNNVVLEKMVEVME
jgi:hypothetical protein